MAKDFVLTDEMKSFIGWESKPWPYEVTRNSVRAFARGVGYTDLVYYDVDIARKAGYRDLPAPAPYFGTPVFIPGQSDPNLPFPPGYAPDIKHGLPGLLDGGTETEYFKTICAGDTLIGVNRVVDIYTKESRGLGIMLIVATELTMTDQDGKTAAIERLHGIFY